jgi:hypothetical protein
MSEQDAAHPNTATRFTGVLPQADADDTLASLRQG